MKHAPFWVEDHPRPANLGGELPAETDVLVVGSGLTGLTAAWRLVGGGKTVAVLDSGEVAGGASSVNGGMVSPDVKAGMRAVLSTHGQDIAREIWAATVRSVELVADLASLPGVDALTHQAGLAALGWTSRQRDTFTENVAWYRDNFHTRWELIDGKELGQIVGGDYFDSALFEPEGIGVHPARLSFGLAARVVDMGAILVEHCEAISVQRSGDHLLVRTSEGEVKAGEVILATNGYTTRRPSAVLDRLVVSVGSYIIVTEPLDEEKAAQVFPTGAMTYTRQRLLNYMRRTHDNRILLGGRRNLHPGLDLELTAQALRQRLVTFWPWLAETEITHVWGGKLGVPFDLTPHIGRVGESWYALGYAGHGVGLAAQLGYELAGMILGEDPPSVFSRIPHKGRPYYRGGDAWFLTPASFLYRTLDRVGR